MKSDLILATIKFTELVEEYQFLHIKLPAMSTRVEAILESTKLELVLESIRAEVESTKQEAHLESIKAEFQVLIKAEVESTKQEAHLESIKAEFQVLIKAEQHTKVEATNPINLATHPIKAALSRVHLEAQQAKSKVLQLNTALPTATKRNELLWFINDNNQIQTI